jgi:DNA-binding SARP family transcriptional activator
VLGGFELRVGPGAVAMQQSAARLVAFLAIQTRPLRRSYIAGKLWPDMPQRRAAASLRTALWRANEREWELVSATATHLALQPNVEVDLRNATALAHAILDGRELGDGGARARGFPCAAARRLVRTPDELLPDWYDEWVIVERERYRQVRLHALEALCVALASAGDYAEAVEAGLAAVTMEPLRESAHRALMTAHLAEDNAVEALREFRAFSRLLHEELRLDPSPRIRALARRAAGRQESVTAS